MKILVDIGHPAHVHYFKYAIRALEKKGHEFLITTRDKEVTLDLLRRYEFPYVCTGKNKKGTFNKFLTMIRNDRAIYQEARRFQPDLFFSFFSPFAAHVGALMRKPVIGFTDTEFAKFSIRLTLPYTDHVFTPDTFETAFGPKQIRFKGHMEGFYLHPHYFQPDDRIWMELGMEKGEPFSVMRFVSFNAGHDAGETGISEKAKYEIANLLSNNSRLFISSEDGLPREFEPYRIRVTPDKFHSLLSYAQLYVGEGITTASESALLGVPSVLVNTLTTGYIKEHEKNQLVFRYDNAAAALEKIKELSSGQIDRNIFKERAAQAAQSHIDCTAFLVWVLDEFPKSLEILHRDPSFQDRFLPQPKPSPALELVNK